MEKLTEAQKKKIRKEFEKPYVEPLGYFPKEMRDEIDRRYRAEEAAKKATKKK